MAKPLTDNECFNELDGDIYPDFIACDGCGGNWLDHPGPMVHDHIWAAIGMKPDQLLCFDCLDRKLYRDCHFTDIAFRDSQTKRGTAGWYKE